MLHSAVKLNTREVVALLFACQAVCLVFGCAIIIGEPHKGRNPKCGFFVTKI